MNKFEINEAQVSRLKNIAVALRTDPPPVAELLAQYGYDIESVVAECETQPIELDEEETYGKSEDDEPEDDGGSSTEEEL